MIPVTKPYMPEKRQVYKYLDDIWNRQWLTNNGPLLKGLEDELASFLKIEKPVVVSNGTIAIQLAIRALDLQGEIITTPFSYVATTSSIVWERAKPVFVDIEETTFNLDPSKLEEAITPETSAIIATHVFGYPCNIQAIDKIAKKYNLKVIYDAAHAFATKYKGRSIFEYGDISVASFHATKIFHMVEGGGLFTKDVELKNRVKYMRNFGHDGPELFNGIGINGKNSEIHAAFGLAVLSKMDSILEKRRHQWCFYQERLQNSGLQLMQIEPGVEYNYSYFPILLASESLVLKVKNVLENNDVYPRRYFYPSLDKLDYIKERYKVPIAHSIASRILCLPLYYNLRDDQQSFICDLINSNIL